MKRILLLFLSVLISAHVFSQNSPKAYLVSNAHFDSQWNWDVQRSIREYIPKTLDQNLFLLGTYPDYVFNFEGGIKYQWMKEYYPHQYELIKRYIREGRWHVTGSTWDATDPNIPSAESFTRNILYGQHFYRREFGVEGTDIFLPDCFGFGWTLPTIAAHSGLIGFSTQKLMWRHRPFHGTSKIPFEIGLWQGVDGSRIMAVMDAHNYTTKWRYEDLSHSKYLQDIAQSNPLNAVYHYYGTGDTGGAPTIESVRALELGLQGNGPVEIISATSDRLYKDYLPYSSHPELPVWNGELLMDVHATGCYTSQAAMKLYNRRNEQLADAAERSAVAADWLGAVPYPREVLTEAWKRFIWHQFHDDLTGTSLPRAYEFSWNDELISLKQFGDVLTTSVGAVSRGLDTDVKGLPVVLYNAAGFEVSDVVEVTLPLEGSKFTVYDDKGVRVPSQVLGTQQGQTRLLVEATVPAAGYAVYDIRKGGQPKAPAIKAGAWGLENSVYKLTLDANGDISSIVDKRHGRELVAAGKSIRLAFFPQNESYSWPAWEILKKTVDAAPQSITGEVKVTVAEEGPLRASVCVERTLGDSRFRQWITLREGAQADRIDLVNDIDWQSSDALLKAEFPLSVSNPEAVYDLGVGSVARGNNTATAYEVYAQQWADLTDADGSYGVSVLNDSKYGWDKPADNTLRLTLLHTPATKGGYAYQNKQDFGHHTFTYSIVGHAGDYRAGGAVRKAEVLNQPLRAFVAPRHGGVLGRSFSLAASTMYDTQAVFTVDGKEHTALVPYYGGFIGQWGHTGHTEPYLKDAQVAFVGTHKHDMIRNEDRPYEFTYMFRIGLDIPEGARQLVLPDDPRIVVFAATVAEDPAGGIGAACDLLRVQLPVKGADASQAGRRNLLYGKPVVERSGEVNASERAECATDEDVSTKWCDYSDAKPKLLGVDLGRETTIRGWYVMHAALEALDYITKEYSLQVRRSPGEEWKTVDTVYDNTALETDRVLPQPVTARYVRLVVSKPDQSEGNTARIYEFEVY